MSTLLAFALSASSLAANPWANLSEAERKASVEKMSRDEIERVLRDTPSDVLLKLSEKAIRSLGPYQYVMVKQERIRGALQGEQTIRTTIQESPNAIRLEYLKGPAAGRKIVYNAAVKKSEFRVREAGLLAIIPLWLPIDSELVKGDSNHTVPEAGLGSLVRRLQLDQARAGDKLVVKHEGWADNGHFCSVFTLPDGGKGFDHGSTRICMDPKAGLPMKVEGFDAKGALLERYAFSDVKAVALEATTFDPEKGL